MNAATRNKAQRLWTWFHTVPGKIVAVLVGLGVIISSANATRNWVIKNYNEIELKKEDRRKLEVVYKTSQQVALDIARTKRDQNRILYDLAFVHAENVLAIETNGGAYYRSDGKLNTIQISREITDMTGWAFEDIKGRGWQNFVYDPDRGLVRENLEMAQQNRSDFYASFRLIRNNGQIIKIKAKGVKVPFEDSVIGYVGVWLKQQ